MPKALTQVAVQMFSRCLVVAMAAVVPAMAEPRIEGRVVGVSDGDTITLLTTENQQIKVRLAEIDAPEKAQAFGNKSKQSLSDICFKKVALLDVQDVDRYGRTVARVMCADVDANAEQVKRGFAWVYDRYVKDQSLYSIQSDARENSRGLWRDAVPIPPWEFRRYAKQKRDVS
jgi:endonuclease YncB( thermonuclease family)